jgi:hypothetical protein
MRAAIGSVRKSLKPVEHFEKASTLHQCDFVILSTFYNLSANRCNCAAEYLAGAHEAILLKYDICFLKVTSH